MRPFRDDPVVLIHGLWMGRWAMWPLARRLQRAGFDTVIFGYPTRATPTANADRLANWLNDRGIPAGRCVAHSLGGIVLSHLFHRHPDTCPSEGRIVLMASPLAGSNAARSLAAGRLGRWLLAGSLENGLAGGAPAWHAPHTLMLAGTRPLGPGRLLPGALDGPNDGTVTVAETQAAGLTVHRCLPVNHFGMLLSRSVADETIRFLSDRPERPASGTRPSGA
ncbi:alpha/beta hydrolase [Guyparkeria sp. 1SP6A2]|nr:alpha/beta hydrolase [Guyparkeria sp. 1SP6A2]